MLTRPMPSPTPMAANTESGSVQRETVWEPSMRASSQSLIDDEPGASSQTTTECPPNSDDEAGDAFRSAQLRTLPTTPPTRRASARHGPAGGRWNGCQSGLRFGGPRDLSATAEGRIRSAQPGHPGAVLASAV